MMKIEVIDSFDKFCELEPIWNGLLSKSSIDIPFMTFEWFSCWWRAFAEDGKPFILLTKENGNLFGIAPLMQTKIKYRSLPAKAITFIANEHTNRAGFILLERKKEVVRKMIEFLHCQYKFDVVKFDFIEKASDTDQLLSEILKEHRIKYRQVNSLSSPYILIDKDWDSHLKSRSKSFRRTLKRARGLVEANGCYEIIDYSHNNLMSGIEDLLEISRNSWKYQKNSAIASDEREAKFYTTLIKMLSPRKWLKLWVLRADGKPIAFDLTVTYKRRNYSLKTSFDERYRHLFPSVFLDSHVIKQYFQNEAEEVDLLGNSSEYKMRWTSLIRDHRAFYFFNRNANGRMLSLVEFGIVPAAKKVLHR
jgi:CelD/BcsL family acetyltransferase involved in cellulose biosynthesis